MGKIKYDFIRADIEMYKKRILSIKNHIKDLERLIKKYGQHIIKLNEKLK